MGFKEIKTPSTRHFFFALETTLKKILFQTIISEGHTIGNHTYNHLNGWKTTTASYLAKCCIMKETIQKNSNYSLKASLFRPPYGKIKPQSRRLRAMGYNNYVGCFEC
jgi:peptidoglycan/xylan/chitin deacetylase (PgdA/CDA1 family)